MPYNEDVFCAEYKKINNIVFKEIDKKIKSLSGTIDSIEKE